MGDVEEKLGMLPGIIREPSVKWMMERRERKRGGEKSDDEIIKDADTNICRPT